jgi:predicted acyltransferase
MDRTLNPELPQRLVSLYIFGGVTIAGMIVVNNLRAWTDTPHFPRLTHAEWNGCTLADIIFPCFLFIVGVSATLSLMPGSRFPRQKFSERTNHE